VALRRGRGRRLADRGRRQSGDVGRETVGLGDPDARARARHGRAGGVGFDVEMSGSGTGLVGTIARGGPVDVLALPRRGRDVGHRRRARRRRHRAARHGACDRGARTTSARAVVTPAWFPATDASGCNSRISRSTRMGSISRRTDESERLEERWSGFARFDWLQGDRFALTFRASGSRLAARDPATLAGCGRAGVHDGCDGREPLARPDRARHARGRVRDSGSRAMWATRARRRWRLADDGGLDARRDHRGAEEEPYPMHAPRRASPASLHWDDFGAHRLKVGYTVASHRFESRRPGRRRGASPSAMRSTSPRSPGASRRSNRMRARARSGSRSPPCSCRTRGRSTTRSRSRPASAWMGIACRRPVRRQRGVGVGVRARRHAGSNRPGHASRRASGSAGRSAPIASG
jgi:hypothetical protein